GLVGVGLLVVADALAADAVEGLAADEAGDHRLPDEADLLVLGVVFAALAAAFDDFEGFRPVLADVDAVAGVDGSHAILEAFGILAHFEPVGVQRHQPAGHHHVAGEGALALDVVVMQGVGQDQRIGFFFLAAVFWGPAG